MSPSSTIKSLLALSFTSAVTLRLPFHIGLSPLLERPTPISLQCFGGLTPISTRFVQILSPRLSQRCIRASCSSSFGCQLLLRMRRIASTETLKCAERTGVVNRLGCVRLRCRMPSIVSGDNFLRGFQASPPSFSFNASFWIAQSGRSRLGCDHCSNSARSTFCRVCGFVGVRDRR